MTLARLPHLTFPFSLPWSEIRRLLVPFRFFFRTLSPYSSSPTRSTLINSLLSSTLHPRLCRHYLGRLPLPCVGPLCCQAPPIMNPLDRPPSLSYTIAVIVSLLLALSSLSLACCVSLVPSRPSHGKARIYTAAKFLFPACSPIPHVTALGDRLHRNRDLGHFSNRRSWL